ncbi:UbiA prenyltransferase family-domain-containing protein [Daldinia vernicosa]|uniref:UbiA prenyltransferase family-domain-containing protein n=1 Tax=Daldinia vernicosa TaxID=114800 RepID=UPI002007DD91|nr:UbiA prenyltransferase family-domain-containing protein [Daldinia vernicosa]KAI0852492.1 UbiA prenyltransferase family-domain-containing protein [Daldinia vernicosa]
MGNALESDTTTVSEVELKPTSTIIHDDFGWFYVVPYLVWEFTRSNFATFVIPNSTFGILGALVPTFATVGSNGPPTALEVLQRFPTVIAFNWYNVLVFDLGNQRSAESIQEDLLNKPWRPIPTGKVTPEQTRRALLLFIPISLWLNYSLGVWEQGVMVPILSYLYNDLRGGDEIVRDLIIAVAYGVAHSASLKIAIGNDISREAFIWVAIISGVILTTMQVQDLKDQAGDRTRGRRTVVLFIGEWFSRTSIAFFVALWSLVCTRFWHLGLLAFSLPGIIGIVVITRVLLKRTPAEDSQTWKWWCLWTITLFSLPVIAMTGS